MSGVDIFLKYAYAPNLRGFCGPQNFEIIEEGLFSNNASKITEMDKALNSFTGALPYLKLIAGANQIRDPFDARVVEAYWIGNDLLNNIPSDKFGIHLYDRFKSKTNKNILNLISNQSLSGTKPHHSFHVFDAFLKSGGFSRLGISSLPEAVLTHIDECRIGWGVFQRYIEPHNKSQVLVEYRPIESGLRDHELGDYKEKILQNEVEGRKLFLDLLPGDIITFHWSRICDKISLAQTRQLKFWTEYHLRLNFQWTARQKERFLIPRENF